MNRRSLFRTLFGTAAAIVAAPLIPTVAPAPSVLTGMEYMGGYIYCPYMPLMIASDLVGVHPMSGPTGTIFHMNLVPSHV